MHYYERIRISIHAPHAGRDYHPFHKLYYRRDFNPRAPCGARPRRGARGIPGHGISIHAPHAGRDFDENGNWRQGFAFQSTRPMRGATAAGSALPGPPCNFNPRAPCGARLVLVGTAYLAWSFQSTRPMRGATEHPESQRQFQPFQSTRPMRGATYSWPEWRALRLISIHAPHAGRDSSGQCAAGTAVQFQSTRPMRGATCAGWNGLLGLVISIHAPHAGRDGASREPAAISAISIHAPHAGRDLFLARVAGAPADFNPRAPCGARR